MQDFKSKWVLVTGAASGIGRATALAFADAGASLTCGNRTRQRARFASSIRPMS